MERVPVTRIVERADEIDELRHLPDDLLDEVRATGVLRSWVPKAYGGPQRSAVDLLDDIAYYAEADGSVGWCVMIAGTTGLLSWFLPPEHAEAIYGDGLAVTGGLAAPIGTAVALPEGGLRVSGRWQWGSGSRHCTYLGGGCRVVDESGELAPRHDGLAFPFVLFDQDQVELLDTWHVTGMAGSGSTDYVVDDVVVPEGRWVQVGTTPPVVDGPLARMSFLGLLAAGIGAVSVGLARRAIAELVDLAGGKRPQGSSKTLAERPATQADVARADATVRSAWAFLVDAVGSAYDAADRGGHVDDESKRVLRLAATDATQRCAEAVRDLYLLGGGEAVYLRSPLQRVFRDSHVATQHAMVAPRTYEPVGRMLVGLPTDTRQL